MNYAELTAALQSAVPGIVLKREEDLVYVVGTPYYIGASYMVTGAWDLVESGEEDCDVVAVGSTAEMVVAILTARIATLTAEHDALFARQTLTVTSDAPDADLVSTNPAIISRVAKMNGEIARLRSQRAAMGGVY